MTKSKKAQFKSDAFESIHASAKAHCHWCVVWT